MGKTAVSANEQHAHRLVDELLDVHHWYRDPDLITQVAREHIRRTAHNSVWIVHRWCESPIERVFLTEVLLRYLVRDPYGLVITLPGRQEDPRARHQRFATLYADINADYEYACESLEEDLSYAWLLPDEEYEEYEQAQQRAFSYLHSFEAYVRNLEAGGEITREEARQMLYNRLIYSGVFDGALFLTPQTYVQISYDSDVFHYRLDALVWSPRNSEFRVALECDGYLYHSGRKPFRADRARDRRLLINAYQPIRFAGSEILKDPMSCAHEFADLLAALLRQT